MGSDQRQLQPGAFCVSPFAECEGEITASARGWKCGKNDDGTGYGDSRVRSKFYEKLPKLFAHNPAMREVFANNPQLVEITAKRNSSLQGAYMMLAGRALGLDCGPMSGFDNAKVDEEFFGAGQCEDCEQEFFPEGH